ncbi:MAG: hypothetical protein JRM72_02535 [Nitrososphaerota archaeon]|nr:hypothetical protein [Nitrososphaerota archaeon]
MSEELKLLGVRKFPMTSKSICNKIDTYKSLLYLFAVESKFGSLLSVMIAMFDA